MDKVLRKIGIKKIDTYIIKKFLGTFFFSILLILSIAVIIDIAEKIDNFNEYNAPLKAIVFDYYMSFLPFYGNMLTPLFTFISVIFFTSKLANNTEVIAILSSGVSFKRFARPYFLSAGFITITYFLLSAFVIPKSTQKMLEFENQYVKPYKESNARNVHMQVDEGVVMYMERFDIVENEGYRFSLEKFDNKKLISRLTAQKIMWDSLYTWKIEDYVLREFDGMRESLTRGEKLDTVIPIQPEELFVTAEEAPQMQLPELKKYIDKLQKRGVGNLQAFEVEFYQRFSTPISVLIMTLIGIALSSRKIRGGMGVNLGIGLLLSGVYVLFMALSTTFAVNNEMPTLLAVWLPNIVFLVIGIFLYIRVPK